MVRIKAVDQHGPEDNQDQGKQTRYNTGPNSWYPLMFRKWVLYGFVIKRKVLMEGFGKIKGGKDSNENYYDNIIENIG